MGARWTAPRWSARSSIASADATDTTDTGDRRSAGQATWKARSGTGARHPCSMARPVSLVVHLRALRAVRRAHDDGAR
jgi:hypothetical protein